MRTLSFLLLIFIFGCSDQWYLRKALEKNPNILDTKYDSTRKISVDYSDTVYHFSKDVNISYKSDTVYFRDTISELGNDTIKITSRDSTANAKAYYDKFSIQADFFEVETDDGIKSH